MLGKRSSLAGFFLFVLLASLSFMGQARLSYADEAAADTTALASAAEDTSGSWLTRTLRRYFGNSGDEDTELNGKALETAAQFTEHAGETIEVVIVNQVGRFSDAVAQDQQYSQRLLSKFTSPFQAYTDEQVIREYLVFESGTPLDPFALADSERMLRSLEFISDARILVIPLVGEEASVAIVVEVKDRWPFGLDAKIKTAEKYSVRLYSANVAGQGIHFSNELIINRSSDRSVGYEGLLRKKNFFGSFVDGSLIYEDSYRKLHKMARLDRRLAYPGINTIGGAFIERTDDRENDNIPRKFDNYDSWIGRVYRLYDDDRVAADIARPLLVPALRYSERVFRDRPVVTADSNRSYHNSKQILAGLTYERFKYYKTSYLLQYGEIEDIPSGLMVKLSAGYEKREFEHRTVAFLETSYISLRNKGDVINVYLDYGGYLRRSRLEEGLLGVGGLYITPLHGGADWRYRIYARLDYMLGLGRYRFDRIFLGGKSGIRGMSDTEVEGNQRLVTRLESRLFSPWTLIGFRSTFFGFADVGVIGDVDASSLWKEKIYSSVGGGIRLRNPDLVFPTVQLRLAYIQSVHESGMEFRLQMGNVNVPEIRGPVHKPGSINYE